MTGTIRNNTSKARTSQVNRERVQNRRATSVPTGCDSWEQRKSVGRRQFSYTDAPHGRPCHRNASEFKRRDAAKSRRNRHRERTDKMEARWEMCESEPHNPTPPPVVKKEGPTSLFLKLGSDRFHLKKTYTHDVDGVACLARYSYDTGEWRVVPLGHFMDYPEDLEHDVDWTPMSIGRLKYVPRLPEDPNTENIYGSFIKRFGTTYTPVWAQ